MLATVPLPEPEPHVPESPRQVQAVIVPPAGSGCRRRCQARQTDRRWTPRWCRSSRRRERRSRHRRCSSPRCRRWAQHVGVSGGIVGRSRIGDAGGHRDRGGVRDRSRLPSGSIETTTVNVTDDPATMSTVSEIAPVPDVEQLEAPAARQVHDIEVAPAGQRVGHGGADDVGRSAVRCDDRVGGRCHQGSPWSHRRSW